MSEPEIVAYHEQPSFDPETGLEGILRKEWRLVSFYSYPIKETLRLFGSNRVHAAKSPKLILERRYIRRGTVEPWEAVDLYETEEQAYDGLDTFHTPLSPLFISLHTEQERIRTEALERQEIERQQEYARAEKRRQRARADEAFGKLWLKSESDKALCQAWNRFTNSQEARNRRDELSKDKKFMELYTAAYDSYKLPSKRKAMREFLVYVGEIDSSAKEVTHTDLDLQVFS